MMRIFFLSIIAIVFLSSNSQASEYKDLSKFVEAYVRNTENQTLDKGMFDPATRFTLKNVDNKTLDLSLDLMDELNNKKDRNESSAVVNSVKYAENDGRGMLFFSVYEKRCQGEEVSNAITFHTIWLNKQNEKWLATKVEEDADAAVSSNNFPGSCTEKAKPYDLAKAKSGDEVWNEWAEFMNYTPQTEKVHPLFQLCKDEIEKRVKLSKPMIDVYEDPDIGVSEFSGFSQNIMVINESGFGEKVEMSCDVYRGKVKKLIIGDNVYNLADK